MDSSCSRYVGVEREPAARNTILVMKLRIRGNSLRFRLTQGEVSRLLTEGKVSESVHFYSSIADLLTYSLEVCRNITQIAARFENGEILVTLPTHLIESWASTDQVGIESMQPANQERGLRIVIEKDFQCLQPRSEEDGSNNFPHPQQLAAYPPD